MFYQKTKFVKKLIEFQEYLFIRGSKQVQMVGDH
jgi:hypothetical protein